MPYPNKTFRNNNNNNKKFTRVNDQIRFSPLLVIGPDGNQLGTLTNDVAKAKARELGLDLVEVAADARPPVCRIMDYGKYKYELNIKEKKQRQNQKATQPKEVRFKPNIQEHDLQVKVNTITGFLEEDFRVNLRVDFKGREHAHRELGFQVMQKVIAAVAEKGKPVKSPALDGKYIACTIEPLK
jgi:translation initiation factor IF-3